MYLIINVPLTRLKPAASMTGAAVVRISVKGKKHVRSCLQCVYFLQQKIFNVEVANSTLISPRQDIVAHDHNLGI